MALVLSFAGCGNHNASHSVEDCDTAPLPYERGNPGIERFELAEVVARVKVVECDTTAVRVEVEHVFKGQFKVGRQLAIVKVPCDRTYWTTVHGSGPLGEQAILFAKHASPRGTALEPLWDPRGRWSAWLFLRSAEHQRQVEEVLRELAQLEMHPAERVRLVRAWLRSPNLHLRSVALRYVDREQSDEFVEDLFCMLEARSSPTEIRGAVMNLISDAAGRRMQANGIRFERNEPLYDRLMKALLHLAKHPPVDQASAAKAVVFALRALASKRGQIEEAWYNPDGSTNPGNGDYGLGCRPGPPEPCMIQWYKEHGQDAVRFWSNWIEQRGHLDVPVYEKR